MPSPAAPEKIDVPVPRDLIVDDPGKVTWGTVSTIRAPLRAIARFAAYHLDLGAARVTIYLDAPNQNTADFFATHPSVQIIQCDAAYWDGKPAKAHSTHQMRQVFNASRCYRRTDLGWLAHIDVDEFILAPGGVAPLLAQTPEDAAFVRLRPAEMLGQTDPWNGLAHFKLTRQETQVSRADICTIYPEFGAHVPDGFISYVGGKNIARTGLPHIRLGIHNLLQNGAHVANGHLSETAHVGHAHAPSWSEFRNHLPFRLDQGSYRRKPHESMKIGDILGLIQAEDGEAGLRRFYDEMCLGTPALVDRLASAGMLLTTPLDLDKKILRWFGDLPENEDQP